MGGPLNRASIWHYYGDFSIDVKQTNIKEQLRIYVSHDRISGSK